MKKSKKFTIPVKFILVFLTIVCGVLIVLSFVKKDTFKPVQNAVATVITPIQRGINQIGTWCTGKADAFKEIADLQEENRKLKEEIESLKADSSFTSQMKTELDKLRELYKLDNIYDDYPKVAARVISADPGNWFDQFIIDKGSDDGIKEDMNVLAGSGLVGRITYVGKNYSKVTTIISDGYSVSGRFQDTSENCILTGEVTDRDENIINITNVNIDAKVKAGDKIVTSLISDKYLPGILVGYVNEINDDSNNLTKSGTLTPVVDFSNIEEVLVITQLKVAGE